MPVIIYNIFISDHDLCRYTWAEPTRTLPCKNGNAQLVETLKQRRRKAMQATKLKFLDLNIFLNFKYNVN